MARYIRKSDRWTPGMDVVELSACPALRQDSPSALVMAEQPSASFARPNMPGDPVSVMVLVEDSLTMLAKWDAIRDFYLPTLLESLRIADLTVPMRVWWFTNSPAFEVPLMTTIGGMSQVDHIPDLQLGHNACVGISTTTIRRSIDLFVTAVDKQRCTRHCILIASCLLGSSPASNHTGIDSPQSIAVTLSQEDIRLHLMNDSGPRSEPFYDFFKRTLYYGEYQEVPVWFHVEQTLSIHLSCAPANPVIEALAPVLNAVPQDSPASLSSSPEQSLSSPTSLPSSPIKDTPAAARKSQSSTTTSRSKKSRKAEATTYSDSRGLVSFLQQMHGLTKKRTYGAKPAKRSLSDLRSSTATRPILPRLDISTTPSYTFPVLTNATGTDAPHPEPAPSPIHTQSSSLVNRGSADDRRARRRVPYLPTPPAIESSSSDSYLTSSSSSAAALRSLEAMSPRLTEFHTMDQLHGMSSERPPDCQTLEHDGDIMASPTHYRVQPTSATWSQNRYLSYSTPASPLTAAPAYPGWGVPCQQPQPQLQLDASNSNEHPPSLPFGGPSILGQDASTPPLPSPSLTAPTSTSDNADDQPFVVTPEYEAFVHARFEEVKRHTSLAVSTSVPAPAPGLYPYSADSRIRQAQYIPLPHQPVAFNQGGYLGQQNEGMFLGTAAAAATDLNYGQSQGPVRPWSEYGPSSAWYPS
ncbi:hypothetical protein SCP_0805730 [Sparassis crispa]|uniref:Uncharacterized protein n=1 Tax=Sparassis crispa TaxID=139825 RepID=A0A401GV37_9APHY|nr:hypothetical protein SCP_0805730 [Sparassis crispa]GBE86049.1 hypothetical protein SCP_0805730 [Sparassis crispa]